MKRILYWFFKKHIQTFGINHYVPGYELVMSNKRQEQYILDELAMKLGHEMIKRNYIEIESRESVDKSGIEYRVKIQVLKPLRKNNY